MQLTRSRNEFLDRLPLTATLLNSANLKPFNIKQTEKINYVRQIHQRKS